MTFRQLKKHCEKLHKYHFVSEEFNEYLDCLITRGEVIETSEGYELAKDGNDEFN